MIMKTFAITVAFAAIFAASGCSIVDHVGSALGGLKPIQGSGKLKTEQRQVGSFTKVKSLGAADVEVIVGKAQTVSVTTDDNLLPIIETKLDGDTLVIKPTKSYNSSNGTIVKITVPNCTAMSLSGSGNAVVRNINGQPFAASIQGSGNITLAGACNSLSAAIAGSGDLKAYDLSANSANVSIQGSGNAYVNAKQSLNASIMGSGDIAYKGAPKLDSNVMGSGSVHSAK